MSLSRKVRRRTSNHTHVVAADIAAGRLNLRPGTIVVADVYHDSQCAFLRGKVPCDCAPDVVYREDQ